MERTTNYRWWCVPRTLHFCAFHAPYIMWSHLAFAAFLFVASGLLLWIHWRAWHACRSEELDERAFDFRRRQFRRRMQASAMIGIVGIAVVASLAIEDPLSAAILWLVVLALVVWMLLLALADMMSSYFYFYQIRAQHAAEHASLKAQLDLLRRQEGNGQSHE